MIEPPIQEKIDAQLQGAPPGVLLDAVRNEWTQWATAYEPCRRVLEDFDNARQYLRTAPEHVGFLTIGELQRGLDDEPSSEEMRAKRSHFDHQRSFLRDCLDRMERVCSECGIPTSRNDSKASTSSLEQR